MLQKIKEGLNYRLEYSLKESETYKKTRENKFQKMSIKYL